MKSVSLLRGKPPFISQGVSMANQIPPHANPPTPKQAAHTMPHKQSPLPPKKQNKKKTPPPTLLPQRIPPQTITPPPRRRKKQQEQTEEPPNQPFSLQESPHKQSTKERSTTPTSRKPRQGLQRSSAPTGSPAGGFCLAPATDLWLCAPHGHGSKSKARSSPSEHPIQSNH